MKAGLVIALFALRALAARGRLPSVTVFFTPLEEVDCDPYRALMEAEMKASAAVLDFEPAWPGGAVKTARKGSGSFVLRARGRASHAGADLSRGANAILELARQCLRVSELTDADARRLRQRGRDPRRVPAQRRPRPRRGGDRRALSDGGGRRLLRARCANLRPVDPKVRLEIEGGLHYPPLERTPAVLALYAARARGGGGDGHDLAETATGGASEASFAAALGVPTLDGLGADGDGAHALDEHVLLSSLPAAAPRWWRA